jgi:hypothetical protein
MRFRLTAFSVHLLSSACVLTVVLGGLYLGWYFWPGWWLVRVRTVAGIAVLVDVVLGPTLTLLIANPKKPRRELTRDIGIIVAVQLCALVYGAFTLWHGRPLYYTFSSDRLEVIQASDIKPEDAALGRQLNPALAPHWYSRPRWIYAPLPDDPKVAEKIMTTAIFGAGDVVDMPRYFKPWEQGAAELRRQLKPVSELKALSAPEKARAQSLLQARGLRAAEPNAIVMFGDACRLVAVLDPATLRLVTFLDVS